MAYSKFKMKIMTLIKGVLEKLLSSHKKFNIMVLFWKALNMIRPFLAEEICCILLYIMGWVRILVNQHILVYGARYHAKTSAKHDWCVQYTIQHIMLEPSKKRYTSTITMSMRLDILTSRYSSSSNIAKIFRICCICA